MVISYKLYTDGQQTRVYIFNVYIIYVERDDIMLSRHL